MIGWAILIFIAGGSIGFMISATIAGGHALWLETDNETLRQVIKCYGKEIEKLKEMYEHE